jgi:hypothetical protein
MFQSHVMPHSALRFTLALLVGLACGGVGRAEDDAPWRAGASKIAITPSQPCWLSGYSSRDRPPDGKVHDLYAKALAIQGDEPTRFVLVTCDLGSMDPAITRRVRQAATKRWKLPPESVVLNVSHTHCAPEIAAERPIFHNLAAEEEAKLARYIATELEPRLVQVIGAALVDLKPARLSVSRAEAHFGKSRRFPSAGGIVNQRYDEGITDDEVPVLRVTGLDGQLRAIVFGYACHNTTLSFYKYSGDYAGFAQHYVEAAHPGTVAMFAMGCGGDQNPYPRHGPRGLEYAQQHGRDLADAVQRALDAEPRAVEGPLRVAQLDVTLELEPLPELTQLRSDAEGPEGHPRRKAHYLLEGLEQEGEISLTQNCPLQAAALGDDLLWVFISGETVVDYALMTKKEHQGPFVWVSGYSNDVFAYLPSLRVLREGGYEGRTGIVHQLTPTPFAPSVEDRVMGGIRRLVARLQE